MTWLVVPAALIAAAALTLPSLAREIVFTMVSALILHLFYRRGFNDGKTATLIETDEMREEAIGFLKRADAAQDKALEAIRFAKAAQEHARNSLNECWSTLDDVCTQAVCVGVAPGLSALVLRTYGRVGKDGGGND